MLDFLKDTLRPSNISCILALLAPGVVMLFVPRLARGGRHPKPILENVVCANLVGTASWRDLLNNWL